MVPIARARLAPEGLSVADAFGEQLLHAGPSARSLILGERVMPAVPAVGRRWMWTDDTAMAISIVDVLEAHGGIDPDRLAEAFARRYAAEPARGYGSGAHQVLAGIASGTPFDVAAAARVAAGERDPRALLETVVARTPAGPTQEGVRRAIALLHAEPITVAAELGNGSRVLAADTILFAAWCAATHLDDFSGACWACASVGGDIETTCAMVGGIVVGAVGLAGIPAAWLASREPLPS